MLAHPALRKTADRMLHDNGDETELRPEELQYWRWICYAVRNPLENLYEDMARRHRNRWSGPICRDQSFRSLVSALDQLVHHALFIEIVERFSADPSFIDLCDSIKHRSRCDGTPTDAERVTAIAQAGRHKCLEEYQGLPNRRAKLPA